MKNKLDHLIKRAFWLAAVFACAFSISACDIFDDEDLDDDDDKQHSVVVNNYNVIILQAATGCYFSVQQSSVQGCLNWEQGAYVLDSENMTVTLTPSQVAYNDTAQAAVNANWVDLPTEEQIPYDLPCAANIHTAQPAESPATPIGDFHRQ